MVCASGTSIFVRFWNCVRIKAVDFSAAICSIDHLTSVGGNRLAIVEHRVLAQLEHPGAVAVDGPGRGKLTAQVALVVVGDEGLRLTSILMVPRPLRY